MTRRMQPSWRPPSPSMRTLQCAPPHASSQGHGWNSIQPAGMWRRRRGRTMRPCQSSMRGEAAGLISRLSPVSSAPRVLMYAKCTLRLATRPISRSASKISPTAKRAIIPAPDRTCPRQSLHVMTPGWLAGTPEQPPFVSGSHLSGGGTIIEIPSSRKNNLYSVHVPGLEFARRLTGPTLREIGNARLGESLAYRVILTSQASGLMSPALAANFII